MRIERLLRLPSGRSTNSVLAALHGEAGKSSVLAENGMAGLTLDDAMLYADEAEAVEFNSSLEAGLGSGQATKLNQAKSDQAPINIILGTPHSGVHESSIYLFMEEAIRPTIQKSVYVNFRYNRKHGLSPRKLYSRCNKIKLSDAERAEALSKLVLKLYERGTQPWKTVFQTLQGIPNTNLQMTNRISPELASPNSNVLLVNPRKGIFSGIDTIARSGASITLADTRVGSVHDLSLASHWGSEVKANSVRAVLSQTASFIEQRVIAGHEGRDIAIRRTLLLSDTDRAKFADTGLKLSRVMAGIAQRMPTWTAAADSQDPRLLSNKNSAGQIQLMERFSKNRSAEAINAMLKNTPKPGIEVSKSFTHNMSM